MPANSIAINEGCSFTALASVNIAQYVRVKRTSTAQLAIAGILDRAVGTTMRAVDAGKNVVCRYANATGSQIGTASEIINVGDTVYSAPNGQISKTAAGAVELGRARTSGGVGEFVEFEREG